MKDFLVEEQKFYDEHKAEYLQKYKGKKVLIYQNKLQGVFDTSKEAIQVALSRGFEKDCFIIKRVCEKESSARVLSLWGTK